MNWFSTSSPVSLWSLTAKWIHFMSFSPKPHRLFSFRSWDMSRKHRWPCLLQPSRDCEQLWSCLNLFFFSNQPGYSVTVHYKSQKDAAGRDETTIKETWGCRGRRGVWRQCMINVMGKKRVAVLKRVSRLGSDEGTIGDSVIALTFHNNSFCIQLSSQAPFFKWVLQVFWWVFW